MTQFNFEAIGTTWQIDVYKKITLGQENKLFSEIQNCINVFDQNYSRFRCDSLVTKMSKETGVFELPNDAEKMITLYHELYLKTDGLFTPLVGNLLSDAGYDKNYTLKQKKELVVPFLWDEAIEFNAPMLTIKKPVMLDFGAAGKGYLIDLVSKVIEENDIWEYCVDAGGDILYKNKTSIKIGLENPENLNQVIGVCTLEKGSLCGSAGNRRKWANFTHIINPKTLTSPEEIVAVWVIADETILADALATCLFFVPPSNLMEEYNFEYVIIKKENSLKSDVSLYTEKSENFPVEFFS